MSLNSWTSETFRTRSSSSEPAVICDRQDRIPGFSTAALQQAHVLLIGGGGIISPVVVSLVRKGYADLSICDPDVIEPSNLNRQHFFASELFLPKAIRLAERAAQHGALPGQVTGHQVAFTEATADALGEGVDLAICSVDNDRTRAVASLHFVRKAVPVIHAAVAEDASFGWVFVEEPGQACVGCVHPRIAEALSKPMRCTASPATIDILQTISGFITYAADSLLMNRNRHWNYRGVDLRGGSPDLVTTAAIRAGCQLCGR